MNSEFIRDKYYFSNENRLGLVKSVEENRKIKEEVNIYIEELKKFNINIKDLEKSSPTYTTKNLLLNIAYHFSIEKDWLTKLNITRELQVSSLSKDLIVPKAILEKWNKHLISYIIIINNPNLSNLAGFFNIKESEGKIPIRLPKEEDEHKGIVLVSKGHSHYILTQEGEVKYIVNKEEVEVGEEIIGNKKKRLKNYKMEILVSILAIIIITSLSISMYNKTTNTVIINSSIKVRLKVNNLGKVIYTYSENNRGKEVLDELNLRHKEVGESLRDILKYMNENDIIPQGNINIIISGKRPLDNNKLKASEKYIKENKLPVMINNNGIEYNLK